MNTFIDPFIYGGVLYMYTFTDSLIFMEACCTSVHA